MIFQLFFKKIYIGYLIQKNIDLLNNKIIKKLNINNNLFSIIII